MSDNKDSNSNLDDGGVLGGSAADSTKTGSPGTVDGNEKSYSHQEAMNRMYKIVEQFTQRVDSEPFRAPVDWKSLELYDYPEIIKRPMDLGTVQKNIDNQKYNCAAEIAFDLRQIWKNCMLYNAEGSDFYLLARGFSKRFEDRYRRIRNEFDVGKEPQIDIIANEKRQQRQQQQQHAAEEEPDSNDEENEHMDDDNDDDEDHGGGGNSSSRGSGARSSRYSKRPPRSSSRGAGGSTNVAEDDDNDDENNNNKNDGASGDDDDYDYDARSENSPPPIPKLDAKAKFAANLLLLNGVELGFVISKLEKQCPNALEAGPTMSVPEQLEIIIDQIDGDTFAQLNSYVSDKVLQRKRSRIISSQSSSSFTTNNNIGRNSPTTTPSGSGVGTPMTTILSNNDPEPSPDISSSVPIKKKTRKR